MPAYKIMQIVASESTPEKEEEFTKWYSENHLPMLFGYEGVKRASRYQLMGDDDSNARFLAVYEFNSKEDLDAFPDSQAFKDAITDFDNNHEALGFKMKWVAVYELITELERAE
ncbi:DUF4286 family protein [Thermodesulfobacteriota bacterium]